MYYDNKILENFIFIYYQLEKFDYIFRIKGVVVLNIDLLNSIVICE